MPDLWFQINFSFPFSLRSHGLPMSLVGEKISGAAENFLRVHGTERQESIKLLCSVKLMFLCVFELRKFFHKTWKYGKEHFFVPFVLWSRARANNGKIQYFSSVKFIQYSWEMALEAQWQRNMYLVTRRWMNFYWYSAENFSTFKL